MGAKIRFSKQVKNGLIIAAFIAPAFIFYGVYVLYAIGTTFYYSFFEWSGVDANRVFIGLTNYVNMIADQLFWTSLKNNIYLVLGSCLTQLPLGLIMALLLFAPIRGMRLFRTVYFMPLLMSTVAIGLLFTFIYDPNFGIINQFLGSIGLESWQRGWLGDEETALWVIIFTVCWQFAPFYMIIFRAAIVGISEEIYEAAKLDGANGWQRFRYVTLPLLQPTIVTSAILAIIGSLKYFDLIYIMTNGGPNNSTELMATYMYKKAFTTFNMGYGSAISFVMFLIAFFITLLVLAIDHRQKTREEMT